MDARIDPLRILGLRAGDAHIVRNAGGRARDALRSLIVSQELLGTRQVLVIHHTDCGILGLSEEALRERLGRRYGADASDLAFWPFADLDAGVREDVALLRACPFMPPELSVLGFVYDVRTGLLRPVPPDPSA